MIALVEQAVELAGAAVVAPVVELPQVTRQEAQAHAVHDLPQHARRPPPPSPGRRGGVRGHVVRRRRHGCCLLLLASVGRDARTDGESDTSSRDRGADVQLRLGYFKVVRS